MDGPTTSGEMYPLQGQSCPIRSDSGNNQVADSGSSVKSLKLSKVLKNGKNKRETEPTVPSTQKGDAFDSPEHIGENQIEMIEFLSRDTAVEPKWNHYVLENVASLRKPKPTGSLRKALFLYFGLAFVSFVFLLISSCPIPWYRGKDSTVGGINYQSIRFTIWGQFGGRIAQLSKTDTTSCLMERQFYQMIATATITACGFCFLSLITAGLRLGGYGHYGWTVLFGIVTCFWGFTATALCLNFFHHPRCDKPMLDTIANLDAGFLLTLYASIFTFVGVLMLVGITGWNIAPALKCVRAVDIFYLAALLVSLLLVGVGSVSTMWKRDFDGPLVSAVNVAYWHTDTTLNNNTHVYYTPSQYHCPYYTWSMRNSVFFLLSGSIALLVASLLAVFALLVCKLSIASCIVAGLASISFFISWGFSISIFHQTLCKDSTNGTLNEDYPGLPSENGSSYTKFEGYKLQEGVILVIVASFLSLGSVVFNLLLP